MIEHGLKTTRAVKYEKNSFHDAMLRIVAVSSLLPLFSAVIAFCIFAYIYFNAGILAENKNDNEAVAHELRSIFQTYVQELNASAFDFEAKLPQGENANTFLTLEIQFMNRQGHSADFYLFDENSRLLFSSTSMPLSFMPPDVGRNWGLYKRMEERPGTVQCTFFRGNLLIGKKLAEGCAQMSSEYTGALIAITRHDNLQEVIDTGVRVDGLVRARLLESFFFKNAPLHDGAVVIRNDRLEAAQCILPVSNDADIPKRLGLRHRAAIGLAEQSDALLVVVSEETGSISLFYGTKRLEGLTQKQLQQKLNELLTI